MGGLSFDSVISYLDTSTTSSFNHKEQAVLVESGGNFRYYIEEVHRSRPAFLPPVCEVLDLYGRWSEERISPLRWGGCARRWRICAELPSLEES